MKRDLNSIILTRQELQIMKVVWGLGTATVKDVCNAMSQQRKTAYTTVLTLMGILEDKGVLIHKRNGRAFSYQSLLSREQATRNHIQDLLIRFFDGKSERLVDAIRSFEWGGGELPGHAVEQTKIREQHQIA